jgi:hypothetical protein
VIARALALGTMAALAVTASTSASAKAKPTCKHAGEHVVRVGVEAEVLARRRNGDGQLQGAVACIYRGHRRVALSRDRSIFSVTAATLRIRGYWVAYEYTFADGSEAGDALIARDLTKDTRSEYIIDSSSYGGGTGEMFTSFVLSRTGSVAFFRLLADGARYPGALERCEHPTKDPNVPAHVTCRTTGLPIDPDTGAEVIDPGPSVTGPLKVSGDNFSYTSNGQPKLAALP